MYVCTFVYVYVYVCLRLFTFVTVCNRLYAFVYICNRLFTFVIVCLRLFTFVSMETVNRQTYKIVKLSVWSHGSLASVPLKVPHPRVFFSAVHAVHAVIWTKCPYLC